MSAATHKKRFDALSNSSFQRYAWYAVGEVLLIFAGITLALWFSNWNDHRNIRALERETLSDIAQDLGANIASFKSTILEDQKMVAACERFITALAN